MASSLKKNQSHLSLVRKEDPTPLPEVQVISYEKLSLAQIGVLNKYLSISDSVGNCVGAVVGPFEWDIRPLVIENNRLTITRFTEPENDGSDYKKFMSFGKTLQISSKLTNILDFGSTSDQLWVKRVFYQSTLKDKILSVTQLSFSEKKSYCLQLAYLLQTLHEKKIYHGNICQSNITLFENKPVYLDFGLAAIAKNVRQYDTIAPEVRAGEPLSAAADIFSLGKVFETIIESIKSLPLAGLINNMTCENPEERIQLYEVIEYFEDKREQEPLPVAPRPVYVTPNLLGTESSPQSVYTAPKTGVSREQGAGKLKLYIGGILLGLFLAYLYIRPSGPIEEPNTIYDQQSYTELWQSGQPSMMQVVVRAAAEKNERSAQLIIVKDVLSGKEYKHVNSNLIKTAFDPRWEATLSDQDRRIILILSTAGLFARDIPQMPSLTSASPIVLLSILGALQIESPITDLQAIPVERLMQLPSPFDKAFREFVKLRSVRLDDPSVRALAHIVLGNFDEKMIESFFAQAKKDVDLFKMTRILLPLLPLHKDLDAQLYGFLVTRSQVFAQAYRWFSEEAFSNWDSVGRGDKIAIVSGIFPDKQLPFEKYADLLKHPNPRIARESAKIINERFYAGKKKELLAFLASEKNKLTRYQTISVLAALSLDGKEATEFYSKWFHTKPDVNSVLEFMLLRSDSKANDLFNLSAAQYLADKKWSANHDTLKRLVLHPEALARALAYAKLDRNNPKDLSLLNAMSIAEPNPRLREQISKSLGR